MDIKFDSLASLSASSFAKAGPSEYPAGRYSGTIMNIKPATEDSKSKFCLRITVSTKLDADKGKPSLWVNDMITFTVRKEDNGVETYSLSWAAVNAFCDLVALAGHDRDEAYATFKRLSRTFESGDISAIPGLFIEIAALAATLTGTRVAPNITWTEDGQFANVRGSRANPSYLSAANEIDPGASFTGDDLDTNPPAPARRLLRGSDARKAARSAK